MMYMLVPLYVYIGTLASIYKGSNMEVQGFSVLYIYICSLWDIQTDVLYWASNTTSFS